MDSNHMNHAFEKYLNIFRAELPLDECFDLLERKLCIGGRRAVMYFIDGLHDGQKGQLLLNYLLAVQPETMQGLHESKDFLEAAVPFMDASVIEPQTDAPPKQHPMQYAEKGKLEEETLQRKQAHRKGKKAQGAAETEASDVVCAQEGTEVSQDEKRHMEAARMEALTADAAYDCYLQTLPKLYAGLVPLLVEGLDKIIILDARAYPARAVEEPEKEKTLRGARDGFTENMMQNVAMIRRRLRSNQLIFKVFNVGTDSKSDVVLCYMKDRADAKFVEKLESALDDMKKKALAGRSAGQQPQRGGQNRPQAERNGQAEVQGGTQSASRRGRQETTAARQTRASEEDALRIHRADSGDRTKADAKSAAADSHEKMFRARLARREAEQRGAAAFDALTVTDQSLLEHLQESFGIASSLNPFPRVRYTQRPDVAAAHLEEGKVVLITDNSPTAMMIPVSVFEFFQDTDDYYFPQLTGNYFRFLRILNFMLILFLTPIYVMMVEYDWFTPNILRFFVPEDDYAIAIFWQFMLLELAIDALKLASLNTPTSLGMSLSVIGALILGEFSISSGWFIPQTILCMAVVALASFTQPSIELSYAMKFCRVLMLIGAQLLGLGGILAAAAVSLLVMATTKTLSGTSYLYPLFPFDAGVLKRLIFRTKR